MDTNSHIKCLPYIFVLWKCKKIDMNLISSVESINAYNEKLTP